MRSMCAALTRSRSYRRRIIARTNSRHSRAWKERTSVIRRKNLLLLNCRRSHCAHDSRHARRSLAITVMTNNNVTVVVSHRLGKDEAIRRLKDGFAGSSDKLGGMIAIEQQTWQGDTLRFRVLALGQAASASIQVLKDAL